MNTKEKEIIVQLICDKQTEMIIKDYTSFQSEEYINLEALKIKVKSLKEE